MFQDLDQRREELSPGSCMCRVTKTFNKPLPKIPSQANLSVKLEYEGSKDRIVEMGVD